MILGFIISNIIENSRDYNKYKINEKSNFTGPNKGFSKEKENKY